MPWTYDFVKLPVILSSPFLLCHKIDEPPVPPKAAAPDGADSDLPIFEVIEAHTLPAPPLVISYICY